MAKPTHTILSIFATFALAACSSAESADVAASEDDVVTARCPASLSVNVSEPSLFKTVPTKYFNGSPLTPNEQSRVKAAMAAARERKAEKLEGSSLVKKSGTCTYTGQSVSLVLRSKGGKDRLDIYRGENRIYAFPVTYSRDGLTFAANSKVGLFVNVVASGQGEATLNVRVGTVVVSSPTGSPVSAGASSLRFPVLGENGKPIVGSFPKTVQIDSNTGAEPYKKLAEQISASGVDPMMFASPTDYQTTDPTTTLCFGGNPRAVCGLLASLSDSIFGDMFQIAQNENDALDCKDSPEAVKLTYFMSESDHTGSATIPRCK